MRKRKKKKANKFLVSSICRRTGRRRRPVVLRDARPKDKDHDDGEEGEKGLEEAAVDATVRTVADMDADDELEDLSNGKEEGGSDEIYYKNKATLENLL